jgi:hypothetical protein
VPTVAVALKESVYVVPAVKELQFEYAGALNVTVGATLLVALKEYCEPTLADPAPYPLNKELPYS